MSALRHRSWLNATDRALQKIVAYGYSNVEIITASAETLPFADGVVDLIVSNLGINNSEKRDAVFSECLRVLKPGGKLALTTNVKGHWAQFYNVFEETLAEQCLTDALLKMKEQQGRRGSIDSVSLLMKQAGFEVSRVETEVLNMTFANGTAFFNHHFVKVGWLASWLVLVEPHQLETVFSTLERKLNLIAGESNCLHLSVPIVYLEAARPIHTTAA